MSWSEHVHVRGEPTVVQDIFKEVEKMPVADRFMPDRMVDDMEVKWIYRRDTRGIAPMLAENEAAPFIKPRYETRMAEMEFARVAVRVSRYMRENKKVVNFYQDSVELAAAYIARRVEVDKIVAMKNSVDTSDADMEGIYWKDCATDNSQWVNGGSNTDIEKDVTNAIDQIYDASGFKPDIMLVPPFVASELRRVFALQGYDKWGPLAPQVMQSGVFPGSNEAEGYIGQVHGLQIWESGTRYQIDDHDLESPLELALGNDVLIFKSGSKYGEGLFYHKMEDVVVEQPLENWTVHQAGIAWIPVVYNEKFGHLIENAVA